MHGFIEKNSATRFLRFCVIKLDYVDSYVMVSHFCDSKLELRILLLRYVIYLKVLVRLLFVNPVDFLFIGK